MTPERKAELRAMVEISDYGPEWKTRGETVDALTFLELLDEIERLEKFNASNADHARLANANHDLMAKALAAANKRAEAAEAKLAKAREALKAADYYIDRLYKAYSGLVRVSDLDEAEAAYARALTELGES